MPAFLVHVNATIQCPHGGTAQVVTTNARTFVKGQPVATFGDFYPIVGCPIQQYPCVMIQWIVPAVSVFVNGQPAILQSSVGLCITLIGVPAGAPLILATQASVGGT